MSAQLPAQWLEGAKAARAGAKPEDCPYPPGNFNYVLWLNGWANATHNMAKEAISNPDLF